MWQRFVDLMTPQPRYSSPEALVKALEARATFLEERADIAEKEAKLRERIAKARERIGVVTPRPNYLRWVVWGVGVVILFLLVKSCFGA